MIQYVNIIQGFLAFKRYYDAIFCHLNHLFGCGMLILVHFELRMNMLVCVDYFRAGQSGRVCACGVPGCRELLATQLHRDRLGSKDSNRSDSGGDEAILTPSTSSSSIVNYDKAAGTDAKAGGGDTSSTGWFGIGK